MLNDHDHKNQALAALRKAVAEALERKRRLGQYAVVWRDGRPQRIVPSAQGVAHADSYAEERPASEVREADKDDST
jgi:hypothetical protein